MKKKKNSRYSPFNILADLGETAKGAHTAQSYFKVCLFKYSVYAVGGLFGNRKYYI
jgi:hypothetical protein